jgi:VIT1/CCC1 family predicted Fe2+/Mn2+ transporter
MTKTEHDHARWSSEMESVWLYRVVAEAEPDPALRTTFAALGDAAERQAREYLTGDGWTFRPSGRARLVAAIVRRVGPRRARALLAAMKVRGMSIYDRPLDHGHAMPTTAEGIGARHRRAGGGGTLRAAVFGVNDGLVSNTSLILGIAGAGAEPRAVLLAGTAGLLAGAFSMAAGEWVSVRSQRELYEHQIAEEKDELDRYPLEEAEELALIYAARGVPLEQARAMTQKMVEDPARTLDTLAREELGLNPDDLGSPWGAALSSFASFSAGALIPLAPFALGAGAALPIALVLAALALAAVGATVSLFSGKSALLGAARMLLIGAAAGAATYGIGAAIGVAV